MLLRLAAAAALTAALCIPVHAQSPVALTLDDAFSRVDQSHPELRLLQGQRAVLDADLERASLRPTRVAELGIENALGSGEAAGFKLAEVTLSLASVLERGGKLDARKVLARSRIDALAIDRESRRLDLLAEVARRYLSIIAAQRQQSIADLDIGQRKRTVAGARQRLQAGASPESVVLTAQAALARAELDRARASQRRVSASQHLAALWGERNPRFDVVPGDPLALPPIHDFAALADLLDTNPELTRFVSEQRIREARAQLARAQATPDLDWQFGVRRLQEVDSFALLGSVSMPLGAARRAGPDIRAAEAELALVEIEREVKSLSLYSTLAEAHGRYLVAQVEVDRLRDDVLPKLAKAEAAAARAYRAGATSYLEWAQLQSEHTAARKQQLETALDAQRALIEIQRLTGQAFIANSVLPGTKGSTP